MMTSAEEIVVFCHSLLRSRVFLLALIASSGFVLLGWHAQHERLAASTDEGGDRHQDTGDRHGPNRVEDVETVRNALQAVASGMGDMSLLTVTYDDIDRFHGGVRLAIRGTGVVQQQAVRRKVGKPRKLVGRNEMLKLAELLVKHRAWQQQIAVRKPRPDESRAYLHLAYGNTEIRIWEWFNDLEKGRRIGAIHSYMKQIAWERAPGSASETIRQSLSDLIAGRGDYTLLAVSYDNPFATEGEIRRLRIGGTGEVEQSPARPRTSGRRKVPREDLEGLVRLLLEHQAWEQRTPADAASPGGDLAYLEISYGDTTVRIWEWFNNLQNNQRIGDVLARMEQIAREEQRSGINE